MKGNMTHTVVTEYKYSAINQEMTFLLSYFLPHIYLSTSIRHCTARVTGIISFKRMERIKNEHIKK